MIQQLPICCEPRAYQALAAHIELINSPDALLGGAMAIALHALPDADPVAMDAQLQKYADTIRSRVRGQQPQAMLAHRRGERVQARGREGGTRHRGRQRFRHR